MSHKTVVQTQFKDRKVLEETCRELGIPCVVAGEGAEVEATLYQGPERGVARFELPEWRYPVVVKTDGSAVFDNYNGQWGNPQELDKVKQGYAKAVTVQKVKSSGLRVVSQQTLANGTIQIRATR